MFPIVLRRLALSVPLLVIVSAITFLLESFVPGDPARTVLGINATPEQYDALRAAMHLDQPVVVQYWLYLRDAALPVGRTPAEPLLAGSSRSPGEVRDDIAGGPAAQGGAAGGRGGPVPGAVQRRSASAHRHRPGGRSSSPRSAVRTCSSRTTWPSSRSSRTAPWSCGTVASWRRETASTCATGPGTSTPAVWWRPHPCPTRTCSGSAGSSGRFSSPAARSRTSRSARRPRWRTCRTPGR